MAFCSFAKDNDQSYTVIENKFITKYLPEADGFAVKVYLYGLYLCENAPFEFSVASMSEVLKRPEEDILEAFLLWEDYDLVEILSKEPLTVQYLPVKSALGRPKKLRREQYADFNKELQRKMQKVGKFISAGDYVKYMRFLDENTIQPQAFLLIVEYCINKQGESVSPAYIFNKAKKLVRSGFSTYEQVEKELSNFNAHEGDVVAVYNAMSVYMHNPDESDYALYEKWTEKLGFSKAAIIAAAKKLKRGSTTALDLLLEELAQKGKFSPAEIENYLVERDMLANLTFRIARKLGVKVQNPSTYIEEYVGKWYNYGFEESALLDIALYCLKTERGDFDSMNELVHGMYKSGFVSTEGVKEYLKEKNAELKILTKIQAVCGGMRKSAANLAMVGTWREWKFSEEMLLEAARRSASSANPVPYMNKILSDWKRANVYTIGEIPNAPSTTSGVTRGFVNQQIEAINAKADRERYYALLREKAQSRADKFVKKANENTRFKEITAELKKMELALAKAEVFEPTKLPVLEQTKKALLAERKTVLEQMQIREEDLTPQFTCKRCSDTGFLKNGVACDCYQKKN